MPKIVMVALADVQLEGWTVVTGEIFTVSPITAACLNYARTARFAEPDEARSIDGRDLRAGASVQPEPEPAGPVKTPKVKTPRKKRTYQRRDLTAER